MKPVAGNSDLATFFVVQVRYGAAHHRGDADATFQDNHLRIEIVLVLFVDFARRCIVGIHLIKTLRLKPLNDFEFVHVVIVPRLSGGFNGGRF